MNENDFTFTPGQVYIVPNRKRYDTLNWYPSNFVEIRPKSTNNEKPVQRIGQVSNEHKRCKRCKRDIKPSYTFCYHCHMVFKRAAAMKGEIA